MTPWNHLNSIQYLDWLFGQDDIKSGSLMLSRDLTCASLAIDTLNMVVRCGDPAIADFQRDTPLTYFHRGMQRGIYYVQDIERVKRDEYRITAVSAVGLLDRGQHMGGIYTGLPAEDIILDICGTVPVIVKTHLMRVQLFGWLPIASRRSNLGQVLFAMGAALKTDLDGNLRVENLWDGVTGYFGQDTIYRDGASVKHDGKITQVSVTEHQYIAGPEESTLFEGAAQAGDIITFSDPMHSLRAEGFSILDSGANYAKLSGGTGKLYGKSYVHNTRQIVRQVASAPEPNIKTVTDATLVSQLNSIAAADRLANYYQHTRRVDSSVVFTGQTAGDRINIVHPFDDISVNACLESAELSLSGIIKAKASLLSGYVPEKAEDMEYFDHVEVLQGTGTFTFPADVTSANAVLISGGQGGWSGHRGKPGKQGGTLSWNNGSGQEAYTSIGMGWGGDGGDGGEGAPGGRIRQVTIDVSPGQKVSYKTGKGGAGGVPAPDGTSQIGALGGETTFGAYTTAGSSPSSVGYLDPISGKFYGTAGGKGLAGGRGAGVVPPEDNRFVQEIPGDSNRELERPTLTGPNGTVWTAGSWGALSERRGSLYAGSGYSGGGGAAYGTNGPAGGPPGSVSTGATGGSSPTGYYARAQAPAGADGATPASPGFAQTVPGGGGNGGHGGGGGGGEGRATANHQAGYTESVQLTATHAGAQSQGGLGSAGGAGADGIILIYYRTATTKQFGWFRTRDGKWLVDRLRRQFIV